MVLLAVEHRDWVLRAVDHAGGQRRIDFAQRHWRRGGAHRLHRVDLDTVVRHADLHALQILGRLHRFLGDHVAGAVEPVGGQDAETLGGQLVVHFGEPRRLGQLENILVVVAQVWPHQDAEIGNVIGEKAAVGDGDDRATEFHLLHHVLLRAKLRARVELQFALAAGLLREDLGPLVDRLVDRLAGVVLVRDLDRVLRGNRIAHAKTQRNAEQHAQQFLVGANDVHESSSLIMVEMTCRTCSCFAPHRN